MPKANVLFYNEGWFDVSKHYPDCTVVYESGDALITFARSKIDGHPFIEAECIGESIPLTLNEIIAIYMQCLELGWLYEEVYPII